MLTITKYHKHLCYRKDGNRLGRRKEQAILAKTLERSMLKHEINSYAGRMGKSINYCVVDAGMVGRGHMPTSFGSMGAGIITVNGVPHNSMDEFDWPVSNSAKAQCMDLLFKARKAYKMETTLEEGDNTYIPRKGLEGVTLKPNEIKIGMVTKVSITRGVSSLIEPIKPEDCLGYNKELCDFFKANPPIPITG
jgi:hypothetical protein